MAFGSPIYICIFCCCLNSFVLLIFWGFPCKIPHGWCYTLNSFWILNWNVKKTLVSMAYKTKRLPNVRWNFIAFIWYSAIFFITHFLRHFVVCECVCSLLSRSIFGRINKWAHIWKFDFSIHCAPHHIFIKFRF